ncbi:MAG: response regulator transcription factor [Armatimonadetes bacterium]|nr:response regulator transcription factor [Armatimonadota bacterium]
MSEILIIEDDPFLLSSLKQLLEANSFVVREACNAQQGFAAIAEHAPSLLILDLGLPDEDGVSLCRRIRTKWTFPILMLTSRSDLLDKIIGLEVGADDYVTKPFEARELLARIRACLRRTSEYKVEDDKSETLTVGPLTLDMNQRLATVDGQRVVLTALEFRLLHYLMANSGRVLEREQLFESVWGYDDEFNSNSLDVFVYRLRTKLEKAMGKKAIQTVRGFGYRFVVED